MEESDSLEKTKICMIQFSYNNSKIINQLKKRGQYIKSESWKDLKKMNKKMTSQFRVGSNKNTSIDEVQRPITCFLTFEYEEGKARADYYMDAAKNLPEYAHY